MRTIRSKILIAMGWVMLISVIVLGFFGIPTGILLCALIGLAYGGYKKDNFNSFFLINLFFLCQFFYRPDCDYRLFHRLLYTTSTYVNNRIKSL